MVDQQYCLPASPLEACWHCTAATGKKNDPNHPFLRQQCDVLCSLRIELDTFIDIELELRGRKVETTTADFGARINSAEDTMSKADARLQEMEHKAAMKHVLQEMEHEAAKRTPARDVQMSRETVG